MSLLPAPKGLELRSHGEYLDDFVAQVDVPSFNSLNSAQRSTLLCRRPFPPSLVHWPCGKISVHLIEQISSFVTVP
jgi:hypothetical protein